MNKVTRFLNEVRQEVRKVTWPTRQETIRYSLMVIVASLIVAAYLGGIDFVVSRFLDILI